MLPHRLWLLLAGPHQTRAPERQREGGGGREQAPVSSLVLKMKQLSQRRVPEPKRNLNSDLVAFARHVLATLLGWAKGNIYIFIITSTFQNSNSISLLTFTSQCPQGYTRADGDAPPRRVSCTHSRSSICCGCCLLI